MSRALRLAEKGRYTSDPNPRVGCVLVRNDTVIGEGWHAYAGHAHAEAAALSNAVDAAGATAYVTLEPCSHHGKTPPCADALIRAGIARVVAAMTDPNPLVSGRGLAKLKAAGVAVTVGVLSEQARLLNLGFISRMVKNRPYTRTKIAMSLDGRTALATGESRWITSSSARADVHRLRAESSAVLTGISTVLADNPVLNARVDFDCRQPVRIILDSGLKTPVDAALLSVPSRCLILTCSNDRARKAQLERAGFEVVYLPARNGRLILGETMRFLAAQQINTLTVEAGAVLNGALLEENLIDEMIIYLAPCVLGDRGKGLFALESVQNMTDRINWRLNEVRQIGPDLKLTFNPP